MTEPKVGDIVAVAWDDAWSDFKAMEVGSKDDYFLRSYPVVTVGYLGAMDENRLVLFSALTPRHAEDKPLYKDGTSLPRPLIRAVRVLLEGPG